MSKTRRTFIKSAGAIGALAAGGLKAASATPPERTDERAGERATAPSPGDMQCVVTGRDKSGKSIIVSHGPVKPVTVAMLPGYEFYRIWGSDARPQLPSDGTPPPQPEYFPSKDGFRFGMFTLPPATSISASAPAAVGSQGSATAPPTAGAAPAPTPAALEEMEQKLPGLLKSLEADHPGMHTTDTVDFDVVLFGEVVLELDGGAEVALKAGDCVIQNGTRHAWRNQSSEKCVIAFSLLGADRKPTT